MRKESISIGNCGEYFVAAELERRGYTVAVPMSNTKAFDILAIRRDNNNQYAIQVKTTSYGDNKWLLNNKAEELMGNNIIYVFVHLHELDNPEYYIIPSKVVAKTIKEKHAKWLSEPTKTGKERIESNIRTFRIEDEKYHNNWDIFK